VKLKLISTTLTISLILILIYITLSFTSPSKSIEILGWYCIDWGPDYYAQDFATIKSMHFDTVILRSFTDMFSSNHECFTTAIAAARSEGLKVGISLFHPANEEMAQAWGLPHTEDGMFLDFTVNRTWIETDYRQKLLSLVGNTDLDYYMFDDMAFGETSNLTNSQYFIDLTFEIMDDKAIMLAYYPPKSPLPPLSIPHWDWYTAPEESNKLRESLTTRPLNNTSLGHFVWLYERTHISFASLSTVYNILGDSDRVQIFSLRYGGSDWSSGVANSILEHPPLVNYIRVLNQQLKS